MELIEHQAGQVTILEVAGRLDSTTAPELTARVQALVDAARTSLLLDLSQLGYLSSAGFRVLLIGAKLAKQAGGGLVLCSLTAPIRRLFEVAAFDEVFDIQASRDDALKILSR